MRTLKYFFEFVLVRTLTGLFGLLSWKNIESLSRLLAPLICFAVASRRRLVLANLKLAFPELGQERRDEIAREFWRRVTLTTFEWLRISVLSKEQLESCAVFENPEVLDVALREGRGVLLHSAHLGNWELGALRISAAYPVAAVVRVQKNPFLDRWHNNNRRRFGMHLLTHHQAIKETQEWLKNRGCVGILMDQNLYKGGVFVDFFGIPAATTTLTALLHLRTASPIVGVHVRREGLRQILRFERLQATAQEFPQSKTERAHELTRRLTAQIESWVRAHPEDWLWGHNRWKRRHEAAAINAGSKNLAAHEV